MSRLNYFQTRPKVQPINATAYLERVGMDNANVTRAGLFKLHRAHLMHIPFENLDIHYTRKIVLDVNQIFEKIIQRKRGGFCYELNLLFFHLLIRLGFDAYLGSARVYRQGEISPEFDHMIIFVQMEDETYLCDVGFGEHISQPKLLKSNQPQLDYTVYYRFDQDPDERWILKTSTTGTDYKSVYLFDTTAREAIEFLQRCDYHQESMDSPLRKQKIITQLFKEGRITLTDRKLKSNLLGVYEEKSIMNEDEFLAKVEHIFGISSLELVRQFSN